MSSAEDGPLQEADVQPKDYADDYDPCSDQRQLSSEERDQPSDRVDDHRKRKKRKKYRGRKSETMEGGPQGPARHVTPELSQSSHEGSMSLWNLLIPPVNDHPENIRRHRIVQSLAAIVLSLLIAAAYGLFNKLGFSGFAYASSVKEINVELLEQRIFDNLVRQCTASAEESRLFYSKEIRKLLRKYWEVASTPYPLPSCQELIGRQQIPASAE